MTQRWLRWHLWAPRVVAILVCSFLSLFALDARSLPDLAAHLFPTMLLAFVVTLAWRWEWVGAVAFTVLGIAYAFAAHDRPSWILAVAAPLLVVGLLYGWSWRHRRELHAHA
jgi:glucose-6-phosphate-specific signal transduction histidine kinase